jgi:hypothetical protein
MVERQPWHQLDDETGKAFAAFACYLALGPERSLHKAYRAHTRREKGNAPGWWTRWSARYRWPIRARAWDDSNAAAMDSGRQRAIEAVAVDWAKRREEWRQSEWELRGLLVEKARKMLSFGLARKVEKRDPEGRTLIIYEPMRWKLADVAALLNIARELARGAAEMPLQIAEPPKTGAAEGLFHTTGQVADALPAGAMPDMPADPAKLPDGMRAGGEAAAGESALKRPATIPRP